MINKILLELVMILGLVALDIGIGQMTPNTLYSKNEQQWVCDTLTELICVFAGFTIFRAVTIDLSSNTNEFVAKSIGLIFFQLAMNISFIIIQFRGINLNKSIFEKEGYQTKDGKPESMFIHSTRIVLLVLGSMVSFSVFVIICSVILFVITVGILSREGRLGMPDRLN